MRESELARTGYIVSACLLGPVAYLAVFLYCWADPGFCSDPPNPCLGSILIAGHVASGLLTAAVMVRRSIPRVTAGLFVTYWATVVVFVIAGCVASSLGIPMWVAQAFHIALAGLAAGITVSVLVTALQALY